VSNSGSGLLRERERERDRTESEAARSMVLACCALRKRSIHSSLVARESLANSARCFGVQLT